MTTRLSRALLFLGTTLFFSCEEASDKKSFLPESTGQVNQLMVVTDNDVWNSRVGDSIRKHFASTQVGLNRQEPIFSIIQIPEKVFTGTYRKGRSVLIVSVDSSNTVGYASDRYAKPQEIAIVKGKDEASLIAGVARIADSAIVRFKSNEISESQRRFRRSLQKSPVVRDSFGFDLLIPSVYAVSKKEKGFLWLDRPIDKGNMNLLMYELPWEPLDRDASLAETVIGVRDSIGKRFVPGPDIPGYTTYLSTEKMFAPYIQETRIEGKRAFEVRGLWEMENFPMGGPYLMYWIEDRKNDRWMVLEGFVFAPSEIQRDYIFEIEAIFRSMKTVSDGVN